MMHTDWLSTHPVWKLACIACTLRHVQFTCIKLMWATKRAAMLSLLKLQADAYSFTCSSAAWSVTGMLASFDSPLLHVRTQQF